ncbi:cytochrome o ubiquinol oxidase subunit IV [Bordetella sp. BOR01]|uniref:cytochrome o ubiquinol oxidase subunit IV n=1 Tax=Bordetella sp. BOR01 TaxID=2854779 RepID=UPI001C437812|nr:cytochrome o ubiquinol oxidase subunit IV [Bordetella sp. BOR01]MBV7486635.1 cytochrome o ubiquinol oxidase subunit IV [Bordetella sp. BOR01]
MNTPATANNGHDHDHGHEEDPLAHASLHGYLLGFVLAAILTAIPFFIVMANVFSSSRVTGLVILAIAIVQIVVHVIYFLHVDFQAEEGWNMLSIVFTLVLVVIALSGSIWIMYHLDHNMMPMSPHDMRNMP